MVSFESSDLRKIGIGLAWFGTTLSIIGLFLGNVFVVIGNIQLICGLILTVGPLSSLESLMNPQNHKASLSFGVGFVFILAGWIVPGLILEQYGVAVLFSGLWPSFSRKLPILGWVPRQTHVPSLFCRQKGKRLPV